MNAYLMHLKLDLHAQYPPRNKQTNKQKKKRRHEPFTIYIASAGVWDFDSRYPALFFLSFHSRKLTLLVLGTSI